MAEAPSETPSALRRPTGSLGERVRRGLRRTDDLGFIEAGFTLLLFLAAVLLWSYGAFLTEILLGATPLSPHLPPSSASLADALWHLATAFLLALPTRHRWAIALAQALALGLDIDHLFGSFFPTVVTRQAHAFLFVAMVGVALYVVRGRPSGLLASGAVLAHIGVDGGTFPLFAPLSTTFFPLTLAEQIAFLAVAAFLFVLSMRSYREIVSRRFGLPLIAAIVTMSAILVVAWPYIEPFTRG